MSLWSAISRLLTVLAVLGLVAGALVAPATAGSMMTVGTAMAGAATEPAIGTAVQTAMSAADEMTCCEPPRSTPDCQDGKACPFAATCATKTSQSLQAVAFVQARFATLTAIPLAHDQARDSLVLPPAGHPPKA